jgi:membrane protease YdiL (CAAX protease family)
MSMQVSNASQRVKFLAVLNAVTEVLAVLVIGGMIAAPVLHAIVPANVALSMKAYAADPLKYGALNSYTMAAAETVDQLVTFALYLAPAFLLGRWRYKAPTRAYGLTLNHYSFFKLISIGVLLYCVACFPSNAIHVVHKYVNFGEGALHWRYTAELPRGFGYLLFLLAGDLVLPPLLEETLVRGYMLRRVRDASGPATAILLTALLFSLAHTQYMRPDAYAIGISLSQMFFSVALGYVTYQTGSLVPAVVAHVLSNSPAQSDQWLPQEIFFAAAVTTIVVYRRVILAQLLEFLALFRQPDFSLPQLAAGCVVMAGALLFDALGANYASAIVGVSCLCVALITGFVLRRQKAAQAS